MWVVLLVLTRHRVARMDCMALSGNLLQTWNVNNCCFSFVHLPAADTVAAGVVAEGAAG